MRGIGVLILLGVGFRWDYGGFGGGGVNSGCGGEC